MYFIVYVSSAVTLFSPTELVKILMKSRQNNEERGITGILLYKDGNFMQVIEGEEGAVREVYAKITADPRHQGMITLLQGCQEERQFPQRSMGFRDLAAAEVRALPGYNEFLNTPLSGSEFPRDLTRCQRLLHLFKQNM